MNNWTNSYPDLEPIEHVQENSYGDSNPFSSRPFQPTGINGKLIEQGVWNTGTLIDINGWKTSWDIKTIDSYLNNDVVWKVYKPIKGKKLPSSPSAIRIGQPYAEGEDYKSTFPAIRNGSYYEKQDYLRNHVHCLLMLMRFTKKIHTISTDKLHISLPKCLCWPSVLRESTDTPDERTIKFVSIFVFKEPNFLAVELQRLGELYFEGKNLTTMLLWFEDFEATILHILSMQTHTLIEGNKSNNGPFWSEFSISSPWRMYAMIHQLLDIVRGYKNNWQLRNDPQALEVLNSMESLTPFNIMLAIAAEGEKSNNFGLIPPPKSPNSSFTPAFRVPDSMVTENPIPLPNSLSPDNSSNKTIYYTPQESRSVPDDKDRKIMESQRLLEEQNKKINELNRKISSLQSNKTQTEQLPHFGVVKNQPSPRENREKMLRDMEKHNNERLINLSANKGTETSTGLFSKRS